MKSPAFRFYPTDYLGSQRVRLMTLEEEGAYINLLCSCWQHGSIPADPVLAARLVGKGCSTTVATTVLTMFTPATEPGRLTHDRLEAEREKQAIWSKKSAAGGRKSAELRKGGSTVVPRVVENCLQPNGNIPYPFPLPLSDIIPPTPFTGGKDALQVRAEALFKRTEKRTWSAGEKRAWKNARAVLAEATPEEWALMEWWYSLPASQAPWRKTDFAALLNNWHAEIEKARRNKNQGDAELPRLGVNVT